MNPKFDRIIILADESADWKIAGLRQLDRLALALNEFAKSVVGESKIDIIVLWRPDISGELQWRPKHPRLPHCRFVERFDSSAGHERVLNTRLLVKRSGFEEFVRDSVPLDLDQRFVNESTLWQKLWQKVENARVHPGGDEWRYLTGREEIPSAERWLLRGSGKSRDGFVARYLNRPISRTVSQYLLKTS